MKLIKPLDQRVAIAKVLSVCLLISVYQAELLLQLGLINKLDIGNVVLDAIVFNLAGWRIREMLR